MVLDTRRNIYMHLFFPYLVYTQPVYTNPAYTVCTQPVYVWQHTHSQSANNLHTKQNIYSLCTALYTIYTLFSQSKHSSLDITNLQTANLRVGNLHTTNLHSQWTQSTQRPVDTGADNTQSFYKQECYLELLTLLWSINGSLIKVSKTLTIIRDHSLNSGCLTMNTYLWLLGCVPQNEIFLRAKKLENFALTCWKTANQM